ncbi:DNA-3-methyladenine glycosylase family protein [Trujillonella endophytica]|uniref:3-methyladenine DNA glycosylase/8-oxoguanine DNA glycosylase n=1 Tax=Trujillonella endophytica TaxID=673521 RepID=A0A1H8RX87_9ACTN|nr:DNA-3-methyladenine glycosylase [Trujillella endophytica]SEO70906.1 3-methyladenine DNA glycosylase/8-oxoguanine DNA glycosylase [Trujillella endophytica]
MSTTTTLSRPAPPSFEDAFAPDWPLDVRRTLSVHLRGTGDPTLRFEPDRVWRVTSTPDGAATVRIAVVSGEVRIAAWGPGAEWAGSRVPAWLGRDDDPSELDCGDHPLLSRLHRTTPWLRLGRTGRTWDCLVPAVLEQKVTTTEAHRVWRALLRLAGEPAPGPAPDGMRVPPSPRRLLEVTDWEWHRCGLDGARRRALRAVTSVAARMEPPEALDSADLQRRLRTVPGIGVWTAAEVVQRVFGCPDTVSYGDYHLKNQVGFALTGAARTDDDAMMALLEPWRGQRHRVVRLLLANGLARAPRFGPRNAPTDHRRI